MGDFARFYSAAMEVIRRHRFPGVNPPYRFSVNHGPRREAFIRNDDVELILFEAG
jgi:hypothetical protein